MPEETRTVHNLAAGNRLRQTRSSTNPIESCFSGVRKPFPAVGPDPPEQSAEHGHRGKVAPHSKPLAPRGPRVAPDNHTNPGTGEEIPKSEQLPGTKSPAAQPEPTRHPVAPVREKPQNSSPPQLPPIRQDNRPLDNNHHKDQYTHTNLNRKGPISYTMFTFDLSCS
jgi:hypothetical protein